ncbi:YwqG family protein [Mucilaginibacter sp. KACC 22773]|uniref:YwqG family protein n=1 Tax=Mucilaginibacter sp. KACC 22773 TaxID=3025671 RepID=UPI002366A155|nr:YwqG family protein [Mucilaginibacter sp. KACC 22773]WDF78367.1 YwqG family protein [Mucilaginibacter sp. KACC 22773]
MGITRNLFKWRKVKDKYGKQVNIGYAMDGNLKTLADVGHCFKAFGLTQYLPAIIPHVQPRIDLTLAPVNENELTTGQSKVGGQPDLPESVMWPITEEGKPMSFIAQLNCRDFAGLDESGLLPAEGVIAFFYCADQAAWGFDPKDEQRFKVIYFNPTTDLKRRQFPGDLPEESQFNSNSIKAEKSLSIPRWREKVIDDKISEDDFDNYAEVASGVDNQIFGYANYVQNPMELECQLVTNGLYCGNSSGYEDPQRAELENGINDWILLLQIGSEDDKTGMMWGDAGRLYYWIKKQDLKEKRFDKAWFILQCH